MTDSDATGSRPCLPASRVPARPMATLLQITQARTKLRRSGPPRRSPRPRSATTSRSGSSAFETGAGKSTLLRVLLGEEELDSGEVVRHPGLRLGYLRQHDPFLPDETAQQILERDSNEPSWKCGEVAGRFELKGGVPRWPGVETVRAGGRRA